MQILSYARLRDVYINMFIYIKIHICEAGLEEAAFEEAGLEEAGLEEAGLKEAGLENAHHDQTLKNLNCQGLPKRGLFSLAGSNFFTFLGLRTVPPTRGLRKLSRGHVYNIPHTMGSFDLGGKSVPANTISNRGGLLGWTRGGWPQRGWIRKHTP